MHTLLRTALLFSLALTAALSDVLPSSSASKPERWIAPVDSPSVLRTFDPPDRPWLPGHRGVDLGAPSDAQVVAPAAGTVIFAGMVVDRPVISIMHEGGLRSTYEPVKPLVNQGDQVTRGQPIGTLLPGHEGNALHWGARFGEDDYIDPLRMVLGPSILKPWT